LIVVMKAQATEEDIRLVVRMVEELDYRAHVIRGIERTVIACAGEERGPQHSLAHLEGVSGVECVPKAQSLTLAESKSVVSRLS
jgi:3-deoxy-7-phosphoheptulonate synthase